MFSSSSFLFTSLLAVVAHAKVQFLGVGIAGGDFGCTIDGNCATGSTQLPLSSLGGGDGKGQMQHFVQNDGVNMFRLPVAWQFLVNNQLGATLDSANLDKYDQVMQACLETGAHCMIDIHNFGRFNGGVVGQGEGAVSDEAFVSLWSQLATKYAANDKVVFELMNEPHDLDVNVWAQTCQKAVTAIREAGAASQMILLPGTNFDSAATLVSSGSADALMAVTNPDGSTTGLLLDIHKYLDVDNSGTHQTCTTDNVDSFSILAEYLRKAGRQGLVSETGASQDASCIAAFCAQNAFINKNADVFVGLVGWGAGSFGTDYVMSMTPTKNGNTFVDNTLVTQCLIDTWLNSESLPASSSAAAPSSTSTTQTFGLSTPTPQATTLTPVPIASNTTATTSSSSSPSLSPSSSSKSTTMRRIVTMTVGGDGDQSQPEPTGVNHSSTLILGNVYGGGAAQTDVPTTLLVAGGTPTKFAYPGAPTTGIGKTFTAPLDGGSGSDSSSNSNSNSGSGSGSNEWSGSLTSPSSTPSTNPDPVAISAGFRALTPPVGSGWVAGIAVLAAALLL